MKDYMVHAAYIYSTTGGRETPTGFVQTTMQIDTRRYTAADVYASVVKRIEVDSGEDARSRLGDVGAKLVITSFTLMPNSL